MRFDAMAIQRRCLLGYMHEILAIQVNKKVFYYWLRKLRQEAYANAEKEFPAVRPSQEQQPAVTFAEIPLPNQQNSMTDTFRADAVIHTGTMVIGISNTISDTLLSRLLEVAHHAC